MIFFFLGFAGRRFCSVAASATLGGGTVTALARLSEGWCVRAMFMRASMKLVASYLVSSILMEDSWSGAMWYGKVAPQGYTSVTSHQPRASSLTTSQDARKWPSTIPIHPSSRRYLPKLSGTCCIVVLVLLFFFPAGFTDSLPTITPRDHRNAV